MKTNPFGLGSAKRSRWSASSGTMSAGNDTVRLPARDFGSARLGHGGDNTPCHPVTRTAPGTLQRAGNRAQLQGRLALLPGMQLVASA